MKLRLLLPILLFSFQAFAQSDYADLRHYSEKNKQLPASNDKRVVFLGSSIFEFWSERQPEFWENKNYVNRGISGQISPQLLIRFRQDVIDLHPKVVIILAGSNDQTAGLNNEAIMNNVKSMVELAKLHHIKVILCDYLPINQYPWKKELNAVELIASLNKEIDTYAKANNLQVLDYFTPLKDATNGQKPDQTLDGVHPNKAGYEVMAKVTEEAIRKALK
jgi:lysophospholipase L1-like esterase